MRGLLRFFHVLCAEFHRFMARLHIGQGAWHVRLAKQHERAAVYAKGGSNAGA